MSQIYWKWHANEMSLVSKARDSLYGKHISRTLAPQAPAQFCSGRTLISLGLFYPVKPFGAGLYRNQIGARCIRQTQP